MTDHAIIVDKLSKAYRIGVKDDLPDTLAGACAAWLTSPWKNLQGLRQLDTYSKNGAGSESILWALKDVSFEVGEGEVFGVIGRNGAGKSTLLKILSRITEPTSGRAVIHGRVSSLLEVGTGFHPELTGRDNVYMNGTILGMRKREIDRKFDEIVDFSGVERFLDTPVKRYSSGMKVRLAFAVAAHLEPEILIIDEVLAVGDSEFQKKCLGKMRNVATGGRTVLFVSHNMAAIENLCSRAIILSEGTLHVDATASDAIRRYLKGHARQDLSGCLSHIPRGPDLRPVIRKVELLNSEERLSNQFQSGDEVTMRLRYEDHSVLQHPTFGIVVADSMGRRLIFLQTRLQYGEIKELPRRGEITCVIPTLPLAQGIYNLSFGCSVSGTQVDLVENALELTVNASDYYGTGRTPTAHQGCLLSRAQWTIPSC